MKLKTQFAFLTATIALVPIVFGAFLIGTQRFQFDPREPVRNFARTISEQWTSGEKLDAEAVQKIARKTGFPMQEVALVSASGEVLFSTIPSIITGEIISIRNLVKFRQHGSEKPDFNIARTDHSNPESPILVYNVEPISVRQSIRNRTFLLIGLIELVLLLVTGAFSFVIVRSMKKAINTLERDARIVANGDLDYVVAGSGSTETSSLASSVNLMRLNLKDLLSRQSRMLMGVSHDLKTPIALIQGYADALADGVAADAQTQRRYIDIIKDKSKQLEDLASELIDFLKLGQRDRGFSMAPADPLELAASIGKHFADDSQLIQRGFRWGFGEELDPDPEGRFGNGFLSGRLRIPMNRGLAERALDNLIGNALRYSEPGGEVVFRVLVQKTSIRFEITDNGPGIPEAEKPYVFDAFYRGSHSRADSGHGLGLTIVKAVADLHGWTASVEPRPDGKRGTQACLTIPFAPEQVESFPTRRS